MTKPFNPKARINRVKRSRDRFELVDYDYLHKLNPDALEKLAIFTEQHYTGNKSLPDSQYNDRRVSRKKRLADCYSKPSDRGGEDQLPDTPHYDPETVLLIKEEVEAKKRR